MGQIDYLTPCPDLGEIIPQIKDYELDLYKVILKDFNDQPIARYIVQPSFGPEYAFQIQQGQDDNYVLLANCSIQVFGTVTIETQFNQYSTLLR